MVRDKWLCQVCLRKGKFTEATECDHVIALANGGDDKPSNLAAICGPCHVRKTLEDSGVVIRPTVGVDGWPVEPELVV